MISDVLNRVLRAASQVVLRDLEKHQPFDQPRPASTDDLKEASELMLHAVELVLRAGAKEAKQLIQVAEGMVDKIADKR